MLEALCVTLRAAPIKKKRSDKAVQLSELRKETLFNEELRRRCRRNSRDSSELELKRKCFFKFSQKCENRKIFAKIFTKATISRKRKISRNLVVLPHA
jgi:hypothetical protein